MSNFYTFFLSFFIVSIAVPIVIFFAKKNLIVQPINDYAPKSHKLKKNCPNLGGAIIVFFSSLIIFLFCNLKDYRCISIMIVFIGFGLIGFLDDIKKSFYNNNLRGITAKTKIVLQILIALLSCYLLRKYSDEYNTTCYIPFFSKQLDLGIFYLPFCVFVICGSSNSVNLTDGLDGLAIMPFCITAVSLLFFSINVSGDFSSNYENFVNNDLSLIILSIVGSSIGLLLYNVSPAKIFMGDCGSLSLGGLLGIVSVLTHHQLFLLISGGIFVIETLSVIIQIVYFKISGGKRIFRMSPIHHHFECLKMSEPNIVLMFWIASFVFSAIALLSLL